tara:strand:- start:206 stop:394 length:189 start_codon:yes stop_codon:yes gene_type:complete
MGKFEVERGYLVSQVAVIEAENAKQAKIIALNGSFDGHWKEYDGDILYTSVEEIHYGKMTDD